MKGILAYLVALVSGAVASFVEHKTGSATLGVAAGGAVATAAARYLHVQPAPGSNNSGVGDP